MKFHSILILTLTFPLLSFAQGFYLSQDTISLNLENEDLSDFWADYTQSVFLGNDSQDTIYVNWERFIGDNCPSEWQTQIADKYLSYGVHDTISQLVLDLIPGESDAILALHALPRSVPGCCEIHFVFSDANDPSILLDTVYFKYEINAPDCMVTNVNELEILEVEVYPNPFSDFLYFKNIKPFSELEIYNSNGFLIHSETNVGQKKVDLSHLPKGLYMLVGKANNTPTFLQKILKI